LAGWRVGPAPFVRKGIPCPPGRNIVLPPTSGEVPDRMYLNCSVNWVDRGSLTLSANAIIRCVTVVVGMSDRIPRSVLRRLPKHALMVDFPQHVQAEIQQHLDRAARELRDQRDMDAARAFPGSDNRSLHCGADELPAKVEREMVPVTVGIDREACVPSQ
jgi:hypothetical protein